MIRKTTQLVCLLFILLMLYSCLPDRFAPVPVEMTRPEFIGFSASNQGAINVPLRLPIIMNFSERMNPSSFSKSFTLESINGPISGSFAVSDTSANTIIFQPGTDMNPAEIYVARVFGGVRDMNGNSRLSPTEENVAETTWVFTTGKFAENGFPHVFVTDKLGSKLYRIGELNTYLDSVEVTEASQELRVSPDGSKLLIVNKTNPGKLTILDPETMAEISTVFVGVGPENVFLANDKAYVVDVSGKTISVVDMANFTLETTISFTDGFRPRDIVYSAKSNKLYVSSNNLSDYAKIRVIDASDYTVFYDIANVMPVKRTQDMEISPDGEYIFLAELQTTNLIVMSTTTETVVAQITADYVKNEDGAAGKNYYYLITNGGGLYKIDYASQSIVDFLYLDKTATGVAVTADDELLYVATPVDSTVQIVETSTLTRISEVKVPGTLKKIAVSVLNY